MRRLPRLLAFAAALALPTALPAAPGHTAPAPVAADEAFAQLATLAGRWRPADKPDSPLRIHFYLTAGGTVLVESWERAGKPHSLTLYHRDGGTLLATHYCPQGNQPRLALTGRDSDGLHFAFRDATDLDPATESHQHDLWLDLSDPERPVRGEIYSGEDGAGAQERLRLVRDGEGSAADSAGAGVWRGRGRDVSRRRIGELRPGRLRPLLGSGSRLRYICRRGECG